MRCNASLRIGAANVSIRFYASSAFARRRALADIGESLDYCIGIRHPFSSLP
ncbi:hypothetical protein EC912_102462 [Luteibacter rhizovicinus]|uniref:Uncharacterized protein n=1 Tax=Luteibacter rhizovicinus TaxID=242606 RepID=A0A4R3YXR6_9GAMM|nr:hypothetical protein EC912_102462 [Luteibacter rhizovicinus]